MITREMIENRFKTSKKGYRKDLSVMKNITGWMKKTSIMLLLECVGEI